MAGYSGKPLVEKLGLRDGMRVVIENAPAGYPWRADASSAPSPSPDFVHVFIRSRKELDAALRKWRKKIAPDGMIWVSWPKRASKIETDVTEDVIRDVALPMGLVDVKVCAVDETWSGLKLVIRRSRRADVKSAPRR